MDANTNSNDKNTSTNNSLCQYCGGALHNNAVCPQIKAIEYYENGAIKRVEFKTFADYQVPFYIPSYLPTDPLKPPYTVSYITEVPMIITNNPLPPNSYIYPVSGSFGPNAGYLSPNTGCISEKTKSSPIMTSCLSNYPDSSKASAA